MNFRIFCRAMQTSTKSNYDKHQMGCVIFKGKKIVSTGYNLVFGSGKASLHAEAHAMENLARKHGVLKDLRKNLRNPYSLKKGEKSQYRKERKLQPFRCPAKVRW